jgi:hypothetical protein
MAWTSPMTFTASTALTAAQLNTHLRDNLNETEVAKGITPGAWLITTSTDAIAQRTHKSAYRQALAGTSSTTYTDNLSDGQTGPTVTVACGSEILVMISCYISNESHEIGTRMSYRISGANTVSASDTWAILHDRNGTGTESLMLTRYHTGMTPGTNTFTAQYKVDVASNEGRYQCRRMQVIPL